VLICGREELSMQFGLTIHQACGGIMRAINGIASSAMVGAHPQDRRDHRGAPGTPRTFQAPASEVRFQERVLDDVGSSG